MEFSHSPFTLLIISLICLKYTLEDNLKILGKFLDLGLLAILKSTAYEEQPGSDESSGRDVENF